MDPKNKDDAFLDSRAINRYLFYPRGGEVLPDDKEKVKTILIQVDDNVRIGGKCHIAHRHAPNILFFHGNGEIVSDYDEIAMLYLSIGFNFIPFDYRGYGYSTGIPSVRTMLKDAHAILHAVVSWLQDREMKGALVVMGRSLGSASALEIASSYKTGAAGLILDSAFAYTLPLLENLGMNVEALDFGEQDGFRNLEKISIYEGPTLFIHGDNDEIIAYTEAKKLHDSCPAAEKKLYLVPGAGHNDLLFLGERIYRDALTWLKARVMGGWGNFY